MTCHANQQPLSYIRLDRVFQPGMHCDLCDAVLTRNIVANEDGYFCCDEHLNQFMGQHERDERGKGIVWALAAVAFVALLLLVVRGI